MPLHQVKKVSSNTTIGIWKISESIDELTAELQKKDFNISSVPDIKNKQRIKEWLATRLLTYSFFDSYTIKYNNYGKPFLNNNQFISISHSKKYAAIIINKNSNCGIDIEEISPKIERIKHKFLSYNDLKTYSSIKDLTIFWCAKETLYKYYGKKEVLFIEHLSINNYQPTLNNFTGSININKEKISINMQHEEIDNHILVYSC